MCLVYVRGKADSSMLSQIRSRLENPGLEGVLGAGDVKPFNRKWAAGEGIPLVWVPGAGHNSNVDAPGFVNAQIEDFVASLNL